MQVLVTGGAGYIGTELVRLLAANDLVSKIIVYDNLSRPNYNLFLGERFPNSSRISFVKGELLDSRSLKRALKGIDCVYHLAAKVTHPYDDSTSHVYEQVNHWGTAELVYAAEESDVQRFVYLSSTGVYGSSRVPVDENTLPAPGTFYAVSKLRGEEHVSRLTPRMKTYILRCGNVFGYSQSMRFDAVINKFVFDANFEGRITIQGDGSQSRTFIPIHELASALNVLIHADVQSGTYNLVRRNLKIIEIVEVLKEIMPELEFIFINQHLRLDELNVKVNASINALLGLVNEPGSFHEEINSFLTRFRF